MGMRGVPPGLPTGLDGFLREVRTTVEKLKEQVNGMGNTKTVQIVSGSGSSSSQSGGGYGQVNNQTNLTLTIDQHNPNPGSTFTLTATLSNATNPTGTILFFANGVEADSGPMSASSGSASLSLTETQGQYLFSALYSGDATNLGCNSNQLLISVGPMGLLVTESAEVFSQSGATYTPSTITLTAHQNNIGTGTVSWSVITGTYTGSLPTGTTATIDPTKMTTPVIVIQASCTFNGVTFTDTVSVAIAQQGSTTPLMMLSNVATTVPSDSSGNVESYADATTTVSVFSGPTDNTSAWTISVQSYTGCAAPKQVGTTISLDASHAMTADSASITIQAVNGSTTLTQVFSITKAKQGVQGENGLSAAVIALSNTDQTVPTDSSGNGGNFTGCASTATVYAGGTDDSVNWTFSVSPSSGVTGTASNSNRTYTVSAMTTTTGTVTFTATRSGYSSQTAVFTITKAVAGAPGVAYSIKPSVGAINKSVGGTFNPATVTFNSYSSTGNGAPTAYSGRFIVAYQTAVGGSWTTLYTSSADESSHTVTIPASAVSLSGTLYLAGGTTTALDQDIIPVVNDGATGAAGLNGTRTAALDMYIWSSTTPTTFPSGTSTYTWASGSYTAASTPNGWSLTPGAGTAGQILWVVTQVYADSNTTATSTVTWSTTTPMATGAAGANGTRTAFLEVYQWKSTTPMTFPSGSSTYTWATGTFTAPATLNSWTLTPGTPVAGSTLWACGITISDTGTSSTSTGTWTTSTAYAIGASGTNGTNGSNGVRGGIIVSVSVAYDGPNGSFAAAAVAQVEAISGTTPVLGDVCTDSNGNPYAYSISGGVLGWYSTSLVLNGNVVVTGTLTANKIVTNSITSLQLGNNATTNIYSGGGVVAGSNSASSTSIPASIYYIQCPPPSGGRNAGGTGKITIIATGTLYTTNANNHAWSVAIYRTDTEATLQSSNIIALSADTGTYGQDFAITAVDTVADTATPSYTVTLTNSATAGSGTTTASFGVICFDNYK